MSVDIWTNSRLKEYQACPMKEKFRYRDCLVPIGKKEALNIGTAVHRGIEMWSVDEGIAALKFDFPTSTEEADSQEIIRGTVRAMLNGYFNAFEPFDEVLPEVGFSLPARYPTKRGMRRHNNTQLCGKIDAIATINGEQWIVEYKTASKIDKGYFDRLYVDSQITFYMMAAKRMGYNPVGVIYRVIRKPQIQIRKGETVEAYIERMVQDYLARPSFYFFQTKLYRSQSDIGKFEVDVWHETRQANSNAAAGHFYRHSHACSNYGTCPYLPLCTGEGGAEIMYEYKEPHEELDFLKGE